MSKDLLDDLGAEMTRSSHAPHKKIKRNQGSFLTIVFSLILFVIILLLGERIIFDLNRFINPVIDKNYSLIKKNSLTNQERVYDRDYVKTPMNDVPMISDHSNVFSGERLYYKSDDKGRYFMYKLIIHAAFILPFFILAFVVYYIKKDVYSLKPLLVSFMGAAFWLILHLLGETVSFVMNEYKNVAIYVILSLFIMIFGVLAYFTQLRHAGESNS